MKATLGNLGGMKLGRDFSLRKRNDELHSAHSHPIVGRSFPSSGDETDKRTSIVRERMSLK